MLYVKIKNSSIDYMREQHPTNHANHQDGSKCPNRDETGVIVSEQTQEKQKDEPFDDEITVNPAPIARIWIKCQQQFCLSPFDAQLRQVQREYDQW